jgi:starch-binding outer membrane protein, SusD/RagB family
MKKYHLFFIIIMAGCIIYACKKDLDQPALGYLDESKLANKKGVEGLLIGAYSLLDGIGTNYSSWGSAGSNWIYGSLCGSEAYTGSSQGDGQLIRAIEIFNQTPENIFFVSKWATIYTGVQRSNDVLRVITMAIDISADDVKRITGEARFLRGYYHFDAAKMWNKVPFVDESITYDNGNYFLGNDTLIWGAIENDLKYAVANLPALQTAIGRANRYAAMAYLVKAYMFQGKYTEAKPLLQELISNGVTAGGKKFALVNYADNFNLEKKNGPEAVFSAQISVNDGANGGNANNGDELNYPSGGPAPGSCCGFFQPSQYLVNHFKTDSVTGLPDLDNFNAVDVKHDNGTLSSDPFTPYTGSLDPRLDWTVGRRDIPYLDWGDHPGADWVRDTSTGGPYSPKKNVYYKTQKDQYTDNGYWLSSSTSANNINLLRFSEILLWAAEVEIETGNPENARLYINQLRERAASNAGWVKKPDGTPAANYKIGLYTIPWTDADFARKAVRYESMLELAMEGHRFFDLVRWGIADKEINAYLLKEGTRRSYLNNKVFVINKNEYFPIPQYEIDRSGGPDGVKKLKQNPGY